MQILISILSILARRRGATAIATALIAGGVTLLGGGAWWIPLVLQVANGLGASVPPDAFQHFIFDIICRIIGALMVVSGPAFWVWSNRPNPGSLNIDFAKDGNYLLFGDRENGVFVNNHAKDEGGNFWFQLGGHFVALGDNIDILEFHCEYKVDGPSLSNLEQELKLDGTLIKQRRDGGLATSEIIPAHTSVHFFYLRKVETNKHRRQRPMDCEEGLINVHLKYRLCASPVPILKICSLLHHTDGCIELNDK